MRHFSLKCKHLYDVAAAGRCYLLTRHSQHGTAVTVHVTVIEGRALAKMDLTSESDPYVKVALGDASFSTKVRPTLSGTVIS